MISLFCVPIISRGVRARYAQTIPDDGRAARQSGLRLFLTCARSSCASTRSVVAHTALPHDPRPFLDLRCNVASKLGRCHRGRLEADRRESLPRVRGVHCRRDDVVQLRHDGLRSSARCENAVRRSRARSPARPLRRSSARPVVPRRVVQRSRPSTRSLPLFMCGMAGGILLNVRLDLAGDHRGEALCRPLVGDARHAHASQ